MTNPKPIRKKAHDAAIALIVRLDQGDDPSSQDWLDAAAPWVAIGGGYDLESFGNMLLNTTEGWSWKDSDAPARLEEIVERLFPETPDHSA